MMFSSDLNVERSGGYTISLAARQPLAEVVVGVAHERQRDAARDERAEALAGRPGERDPDRVVGQPGAAVPPRDLVAEHRADGAVHVANERVELDGRPVLERRPAAARISSLSSATSRP